jgi:benzoyl-CoA-dihydrodiol lyase
LKHQTHWFVREAGRRAAPRTAPLDVSSRSLSLIEPGSCFAGTLAELAFAARAYMLALPDDPARRRFTVWG